MAGIMAAAGAHVVLNGRRQDALEVLAHELTSQGLHVSIACFDVTNEAAILECISCIAEKHGRLDVLVNNASSGRAGTIETATAADFEQLYRVNVVAAAQLLQASLPLLKEAARRSKGSASVVNIGSVYGNVSPDPSIYGTSGANNPPYYGAAKAGLIQLTRYTACHLAPEHIRVNCISPGPFPADQYLKRDPAFRGRLTAKTPMHRIGDPLEMQGPLLFLAFGRFFLRNRDQPAGGWRLDRMVGILLGRLRLHVFREPLQR